jgi:hypothetical protein
MASVAAKMIRGVRVVWNVASPRIVMRDAPIAGRDATAMIGAADNSLRAGGAGKVPLGTQMTIVTNVFSPCPPERLAQGNAARQSADASFAIDMEVLLAQVTGVDDPRDSGAVKTCPGVFFTQRGCAFGTSHNFRRFGN